MTTRIAAGLILFITSFVTLDAQAQRPNRPLFALPAHTLTEYTAVDFTQDPAMPAEHAGESYAGVAVDDRGHLIVFSRGEIPFLEFDGDGQFVRSFGTPGMFRRAHGLHIDDAGFLWVTDVADHQVMKLDRDGNVLLTLGSKGQNGLWDEAAGTRLLDQPNDVAIDVDGNIYVVQGHGPGEPRVLKFAPDGRFLTQWGSRGYGPGQFTVAHAIEIDSAGVVHVADRENLRIQRYDRDGNLLGIWTYAAMVCAMYLADDGHLYITTGFDGQLARLAADGSVLGAIGRPGTGIGEYGEAHALTLDGAGNVYISDVINRRIQKYVRR